MIRQAPFADHTRGGALSRRHVRAARAYLLVAAACAFGCQDSPGVTAPKGSGSNPSALSLSDTTTLGGVSSISFVSLPPGSVPNGSTATIRSHRTGATLTIAVSDGGFDPAPVAAASGDVVSVVVLSGTAQAAELAATVPPRRRPRVVRTEPPPRSRDIPLNARMTVVFSEPIHPSVVANGGVQLRHNGVTVNGRVQQSPNGTTVTFVPDRPLDALATYELVVTDAVRDLDGDPLEEPVQVEFTSAQSSDVPLVSARIAFVSDRSGQEMIYVANEDGTGVTPLVAGEAPAWSPDGRRIAFHRAQGFPGVYVMNADGTGVQGVTDGWYPAWSPDGTRLAFNTGVGIEPGGVFVINADGSGRRKLIGYEFGLPDDGYGPGWVGVPIWSPDGRTIAFVRANYGIQWLVYLMNADGTSPRPLTQQLSVGDSRPAWSPDGSRILVQSNLGALTWAIRSVPVSGSGWEEIAVSTWVGDPDWSPDGKSVLFSRNTGPPGLTTYRMRIFTGSAVSGASTRQLIPDAINPPNPTYWDKQAVWSRRPPGG